tara:strand:- start:79 stop:1092 length:1014 start_codon:yes stop_codon:yes gene_type:complete
VSLNITIFGGGGFIGRQVVQKLAKQGHTIRIATRRPDSVGFLRPLGNPGQVVPVQANIRDENSIINAIKGADAVINLVGILRENSSQNFFEIHEKAPGMIARLVAAEKVRKLIHLSAIGADLKSPTRYGKSKAKGEYNLKQEFPNATILRPSLVFGPDDEFFNKMHSLLKILPVAPIFFDSKKMPRIKFDGIFPIAHFEAGLTKFQPVYVGDVAKATVNSIVNNNSEGKIFELGGPKIYMYRELISIILQSAGIRKRLFPVPFFAINAGAAIIEKIPEFFLHAFPIPPLSRDQIRMLRIDNIVGDGAYGFENLSISPSALESILPTYIKNHKNMRSL